ncbi:MAG TPA: NAD(P)/FAD-dependent oxidoreductase [Acidimicrobiales bacterium]|nr:NAD(P)/FAD-dependent oxidoreductase [Acidimicrobiales bacterium]
MQTTAVIIGAGHAGLAMSRRLTERSIDHVVLERGELANSWRTERWPTLRLLTPNWQTRLPDLRYEGREPDGFMAVTEVIDFITEYAGIVDAPVRTGTTVHSVRAGGAGFEVQTEHELWRARSVVLATGACNRAAIPAVAGGVPSTVAQVTPMTYRGADELPEGGVLVVGASATGCQLAEEIRQSGRPVTISVGEHVRMPRTYRGRDIFWWMDRAGILDERHDEVDDLTRARHVPSPQLVGTPERSTLDLNRLRAEGVRIVGRLGRVVDGVAQLSGSLANVCALADLKMNRLLTRLDEWATATGVDVDVERAERRDPTLVDRRPALHLDLRGGEIRTILWATGYRPDYSWLDIPVLDRSGHVRHEGGVVTDAPGLYLLGTPFLRRRSSTFIHGAGADTDELGTHLRDFLGGATSTRSCVR